MGAVGYLAGLVDGPVLGILGGVALLSFGRSLASAGRGELIAPASFGVVAGAAGVVALRWGTLELDGIGGIQAVLGPIVSVDPAPVAAMASASLVAALVATGVGMTDPPAGIATPRWWWWAEIGTMSGVLALLFVSSPSAGPGGVALWGVATAALVALAAMTSRATSQRSVLARLLIIGICGLVVAVAALVTGASA